MRPRIVFIGSNPSHSAQTNNPFCLSTQSGRILASWCNKANIHNELISFINVQDTPTPNNRPLSLKEIRLNLDSLTLKIQEAHPDYIISLGKTASKSLELIGLNFYEMPHPSLRNRKLNDLACVEEKIKGLYLYIYSPQNTNKI